MNQRDSTIDLVAGSITIDLKDLVGPAVRGEWPAFAAAHPRLAAVLDETLVIDGAVENLADDADYQEALATAAAVGAGADVMADVVRRLVSRWLRTLV